MKTTLLILIPLLLVAPLKRGEALPVGAGHIAPTLLEHMTLEQKIGQLFLINMYGKQLDAAGVAQLEAMTPGGVAIFGFNADDQPPAALAQFISTMQSNSPIPLFIATDQEGGRVQRITQGVTALPDPLFMGAVTHLDSLRAWGAAVGAELHALGVNMVFAPVADLHTRGDFFNDVRVMHRRTQGDDPRRVGRQVAAYSAGLAQAGVVGVIKHFPGHGGAADSHAGLPRIDDDPSAALLTFQTAVDGGSPAIMAGHLYYSQLEPVENLPASLSPTLLGMLRQGFGFDGVIMTDAMDMAAVANAYYTPDAAVAFIQAGGDLFVTGPFMDWGMERQTHQRLIDAVTSGEIPESRIDESVRRILALKEAYGILDWQPEPFEAIDPGVTQTALVQVFMDAATVLRDENALLPLATDAWSVAIVHHNLAPAIPAACGALAPHAVFHAYNFQPFDWEYGVVAALGRNYDRVVFFAEDIFFTERQRALLRALPPEKTILVAMNAPYDAEQAGDTSTILLLYANTPASQQAACAVLFGAHPITGRLPVALRGFASGSGLTIR